MTVLLLHRNVYSILFVLYFIVLYFIYIHIVIKDMARLDKM